jgi:hypothetical protein
MPKHHSLPISFFLLPSSFFLFPPHSILVYFSFYYYQNSATMSTTTAQVSVAGPRVNGSGSQIPLPPSLQHARHTPATFSSVAVRHTSNAPMPSRLPIRPVVPARAPNVSLLSAASKPRCLNEVTFSWPCICTSLPLPLNLHIGCRVNTLHVSITKRHV